jgi:hypothetical protein
MSACANRIENGRCSNISIIPTSKNTVWRSSGGASEIWRLANSWWSADASSDSSHESSNGLSCANGSSPHALVRCSQKNEKENQKSKIQKSHVNTRNAKHRTHRKRVFLLVAFEKGTDSSAWHAGGHCSSKRRSHCVICV